MRRGIVGGLTSGHDAIGLVRSEAGKSRITAVGAAGKEAGIPAA